MLTVFDRSFESSTPFKDKLTYLNGANQLTSFQANATELHSVTVKIKLLLGSVVTRLEGLALLKTVLSQCHQDVFSNNAFSWAQSAIEVLKSADSCVSKDLACTILRVIVVNLSRTPSLRLEVGKQLFSSLIPTLLQTSIEDEWILGTTKCLATCMQTFPTQLEAHKNEIEDFLLKQLDTLICTEVVADCFAELPACGERGSNGKIYCENWKAQFHKLLSTLHSILNDFLIEVEDEEQKANYICASEKELNLPPLPENPYSCIMLQARQFSVISKCLAKMMSSKSQHLVNIPIDSVLSIVYRILTVSVAELRNSSSSEGHLVYSLLPDMQCAAFTLLESLILCCYAYLLHKSEFVGGLFVQSLKISKEYNFLRQFRHTIYKVLQVWLKRLGAKGALGILKHQYIIYELLSDILPSNNGYSEFNENRESTMLGQMSKGNKKISSNQISHAEISTKEICDDSIPPLCIQALKTLSCILDVGGSFLESRIHEDIQKNVLYILNLVQYKPFIPVPYCDARCRKKLYDLLLAMIVTSTPYLKQPLHSAARILKLGLKDSSELVSGFCYRAISICNMNFHPHRACPQPIATQVAQSPKVQEYLPDNQLTRPAVCDWTVNGPIKFSPEKFQSMETRVKIENGQLPPTPSILTMETVSTFNKHDDGCNGGDQILQHSSHEENEISSSEEEMNSDEDVEEEERSFGEEVDNGIDMLNESPEYLPSRTAVSSSINISSGHNLQPDVLHDGYEELGQENNLQNDDADYNTSGVHQNGIYESSEEEEAELENDFAEPVPQKKHMLDHSFEPSPKKQHTMNMDHESEEEEEEEEEVEHDYSEQNAMDMMQDFAPVSPDESQS